MAAGRGQHSQAPGVHVTPIGHVALLQPRGGQPGQVQPAAEDGDGAGQRLGQLPNYDQKAYIRSSYLFNLSARYDITDRLRLTGTINNLFDTAPVKDKTYGSYPYYDISWFDGVGRSFFLQLTYTLGNERP